MGPGKRQGGFLLLDGVLACFLLAAGALTLMLGLRTGVRMIRLQRNLETASREGTALLEEEGLPWGETGERTLTRTPVLQLPGTVLRTLSLHRPGKPALYFARYEKE